VSKTKELKKRYGAKRELSRQFWQPSPVVSGSPFSTHPLVWRTRMHVLLQLLASPQLPGVLRGRQPSGALPPQPAPLRLSPLTSDGVRQRHIQRALRHKALLDRTPRAVVPQRGAPAALKPRARVNRRAPRQLSPHCPRRICTPGRQLHVLRYSSNMEPQHVKRGEHVNKRQWGSRETCSKANPSSAFQGSFTCSQTRHIGVHV